MAYNAVGLDLTTHCNQRCAFCYREDAPAPQHNKYESLVEKLEWAAQQAPGSRLVMSGGEPTLHPDLPRLIRAAIDRGFCGICLFTNGTRLHDRAFVRELREAGLSNVMVSLHGLQPQTHNALVGRESWHDAVAGVSVALEEGITVVANTVATATNLHEVPALYDLLCERFPTLVSYRLSYPSCIGAMQQRADLLPRYEDVAEVVRGLAAGHRRIPPSCDVVPLCLLGEALDCAVELHMRQAEYLIIDRSPNGWRRVGGQPCLVCKFLHRCVGLQVAPVLRHGVPSAYGSCANLEDSSSG